MPFVSHLVLWDIDETLIAGNGLTDTILRQVLTSTYGPSPTLNQLVFAGKTDQQIILEAYPNSPSEGLLADLDRFIMGYLAELARQRSALLVYAHVIAGVEEALLQLAQREVLQSVVTGNLAQVAAYKLNLFGLSALLDLSIGAYGSDHPDRSRLVILAMARARAAYRQPIAPSQVTVIGDTPNDVLCGRAAGATTIAVASGAWSASQLAAAGADVVLPDLTDTQRLLAAIIR